MRPARPQPPGTRPVPPKKTKPGAAPKKGEESKAGIPPEGHIIIRIAPLEQKADVGEVFPVHVWLDNPKGKRFDVASFALSYDPALFEFIDAPGGYEGELNGYDQSEKTTEAFPLIRDPDEDPFYLNTADADNGFVYYRARCASGEFCTGEGFLLSMKFRARASVERTGIGFVFSDWSDRLEPPIQSDQDWKWPKTMTFVGKTPSGKDEDSTFERLLGSRASKADGVIGANYTLAATDVSKDEILAGKTERPTGNTNTLLVLDPPLTAAQAGDTFDLHVRLNNPDRVPWDRIRLDIQYDTRFLDVVDQDEGNWLTRGTNILDGPYHDRFPFEFMRDNQARTETGRILYDCGVLREPLKNGGVLATIRFRAVSPTPETRVAFAVSDRISFRQGASLTLRRGDVLGDTENPLDGLFGASVAIVPRREMLSATTDAVSKKE